MQFNLVNDKEQVVQFVLRGVVLHGVSVRVYQYFGGVLAFSFELTVQCEGGSGVPGGACGWVVSRAGLWGVPLSWVWVVGFSPQILEHPTPICNTGINIFLSHKMQLCAVFTENNNEFYCT